MCSPLFSESKYLYFYIVYFSPVFLIIPTLFVGLFWFTCVKDRKWWIKCPASIVFHLITKYIFLNIDAILYLYRPKVFSLSDAFGFEFNLV